MKILALSGLIPEHITDVIRFRGYEEENRISHFCGYASEFISRVQQDKSLDGAVFPRSCDSSRTIRSYLPEDRLFVYQLPIPARQDPFAEDFFASAIINYTKSLERYFGIRIDKGTIRDRVEAVTVRNRRLKDLYDSLDVIPYHMYIRGIQDMLEKPLLEQSVSDTFPGQIAVGKRVYLIGSTLVDPMVTQTIEDSGMKIVGDNLPESGRLCAAPEIDVNSDPFYGIACSILGNRLSPTQDNFEQMIASDLEEIERKGVQGVIFVTQKYCEPYDYLYYVYSRVLKEKGIPVLKIPLSGSQGDRKSELALEAFADIL